MATAKRIIPERPRFALELTYDEAGYLVALLGGRVSGTGPQRDLNDAIWDALTEADAPSTLLIGEGSIRLREH